MTTLTKIRIIGCNCVRHCTDGSLKMATLCVDDFGLRGRVFNSDAVNEYTASVLSKDNDGSIGRDLYFMKGEFAVVHDAETDGVVLSQGIEPIQKFFEKKP